MGFFGYPQVYLYTVDSCSIFICRSYLQRETVDVTVQDDWRTAGENCPLFIHTLNLTKTKMNKSIIAVVVIMCGVLGGGIYFMEHGNKVTVQGIQKEIVEKIVEKEVPTLDKRIADAISASSTDIETKAQQAYEDAKKNAENEIALRIIEEYEKEVVALKVEKQKEIGTY